MICLEEEEEEEEDRSRGRRWSRIRKNRGEVEAGLQDSRVDGAKGVGGAEKQQQEEEQKEEQEREGLRE